MLQGHRQAEEAVEVLKFKVSLRSIRYFEYLRAHLTLRITVTCGKLKAKVGRCQGNLS